MKVTEQEVSLANLAVQMMNYYEKLSRQFFHAITENNIHKNFSPAGLILFSRAHEFSREIVDEMPVVTNLIADGLAGKDYFPYEEIIDHLRNLRYSGQVIGEKIIEITNKADASEKEILANYKNAFSVFSRRSGYAEDICQNMMRFSCVPELVPMEHLMQAPSEEPIFTAQSSIDPDDESSTYVPGM